MTIARSLLVAAGLAVLAGCTPAAPDPRGIDRDETLLTVTGTGRAEATPDQALFTAGLSSIAPSAEAASARNADTMNRITAALARLGVPARDLQTRNLSVNRIGYGPNRGRFEASNTVAVRVRDTGKVGAAIAAVTAAGANIVSGPNLSVADPERANLGAYGVAYKAARAKADAYAAAANLRVARVLSIRDGGEGGAMLPINDHATADMLSHTLGDTTIEYDTASTSRPIGFFSEGKASRSVGIHVSARRLATPDEIMRMHTDTLLLLRQDQNPLQVDKIRYYDQREFAGLFDPP